MGDFPGPVTPELLEELEELGALSLVDALSVDGIVQPVQPTGTALPAQTDELKLDFLGTALNSPVPFAYGRHLVAGAPIFEHKLATTGQTVIFIALGEGEWDGAEVVWVNGAEINIADTNLFHFHPGFDGETGTETAPATPNQKICNFLPAGFTGMTFSKTAYIAMTLPADPTAPGPEFDIRGIYKTRKVRTFDTNGNQTGYLFSANPAWQLLDAFISLHLKPHGLANEALITEEKDRIDFVAFKSAADFCDVDIGGGVKRFESHVVFLSETNLATIFDTLTALCRGYLLEQNGKLGLFIDQPRNSVYTFTRSNVLASGFQAPAKPLRSLANRLVIKTRDIDSGEGTISKDFAPWTKTLDDEPHQDRVGRIIKKDFDLGANTRERAERVGRYWMNRSLKLSEQGRMVASPDAGGVMPGDRVTGPARTDFSGTRDWEVIEISDNPDGTREVSLQAYDESIFSDTAETQQGIEETTIPTRAQTAFSPTGTHFYLRAVYKPDQLNGSADVGEIDFDPRPSDGDYLIGHPDGTEFIIANTNRSRMSQAAQESYTGRVFIVFSKQKVNTERSLAAFQDSHIIVLRLNTSGAWEYDNNTAWVAFTPDASDILIFEVDRSGSGWAGKPTRYVGQELLSATEAGRLQYASGATVESLEPGEVGANVTEDHSGISVNVLANFSFEDGQNFWSTSGGQAIVITDAVKAHEGNKYLQIGSSGNISNTHVLNDGSTGKAFEVTEGMIVEFGGWAYRESGNGNMLFHLSLMNANKSVFSTISTPAVTSAAWAKVTAKHTVAAGTKYVGFRCRRDAVTASGLSRYDDCFLQRNRPADSVEYASGSTVESLEPAESGADVTGSNQAATIAGQGDLATQNTVGVGDIDAVAVDTPQVAADAINADGLTSNDADFNLSGPAGMSEHISDSVTITADGGAVEIFAKCEVDSSGNITIDLRIREDDVTGTILDRVHVAAGTASGEIPVLIGIDLSPPVGSKTYVLTVIRSSSSSRIIRRRRLIAANRKK